MLDIIRRIKSGQPIVGTMISIFDSPDMARILKECGFDYFYFDGEHGYPNTERLYPMFAYARMIGMPALMRIPEINRTEVSRALDMGADGLICPNVESADQARLLVKYAKYRPMGERGVSFTRPHTGYRRINGADYCQKANEDTILICQMESKLGVENLPAILSVEGVDGVLVGPNDLTQSIGVLNQLDSPEYLALVDDILRICKEHGKFAGISAKRIDALKLWMNKGMLFNQWGSDVSLFMQSVQDGLGTL